MSIIQKQDFTGLDLDTDLAKMQPGSYRYALNVRIGTSDNGNVGSIETVKGNSLISFPLPAGNNKVIGSIEDRTNKRVIYFLCNSFGSHGIYSYDAVANSITKIFEYSGLNFQTGFIITGIGLVNNILSWCDNYNQNRCIDLNNIGSYGPTYIEEMIMAIKKPPMFPPIVTRKKDTTTTNNLIQKRYFQFATRYVYNDNTRSVISPISKLSYTTITYSLSSFVDGGVTIIVAKTTPDDNNYIEININNVEVSTASDFSKIIKEVEVIFREGNEGDWNLFRAIPTAEVISSGGIVKFYNNTAILGLNQAEINNFEDSLPLKSAAHSIVKNRWFWGNNTEGYFIGKNITPTITASYISNQNDATKDQRIGKRFFKGYGVFEFGILWKDKYGRNAGVETGPEYRISINGTTAFGGYAGMLCSQVNLSLVGIPPDWAHSYSIVRTKNLRQGSFQQIKPITVEYLTGYNLDGTPKYVNTWAAGAGIIEAHLSFSSGLYNQTPYVFNEGDLLSTFKIDFASPNLPWSLGKSIPIKGVIYGKSPVDNTTVPKLILPSEDYGSSLAGILEIYQQVIPDGFFYEIGYTYPVTNPGTPSRALSNSNINVTDGDIYYISRPTHKIIISGKTQILNSEFESMNMFDEFYLTPESDIGRPTIVVPGAKQETKTASIRFGDLFVQGSNINGLSRFYGLNEYNLPYEYGSLNKLQVASNTESDGSVLLSIHTHETVSLYIQEAVFSDLAGKNTVAISNDVIGAARALRGSYGTINPESIVQHNGTVYGWDGTKGVVWRYAQDGLTPISDLGLTSYFFGKSRTWLSFSGSHVYGGFDPYFKEYFLTFKLNSFFTTFNVTAVFSETLNRWTSFFSFIGENYQKITTKLISFLNGNLYLHGDNNLCNNFYGTQYTSKLTHICNISPSKEKILMNVTTESKDIWTAIQITNPEGQQSNLVASDYKRITNAWCADVLRDINTPNIDPPKIPILHGDVMRSSVFSILMECTATSLTTMKFVNFHVIPSELSNR